MNNRSVVTHRITLLALALMIGSVAPVVVARDYLIEVVVFENRRAAGGSTTKSLYVPRMTDSIALDSEDAATLGFLPDDSELVLTEDAEALNASGAYRVLRHFAWRQPGLDDESARAIRLLIGQRIKMHIPTEYQQFETYIPAFASAAADGSSREVTTFSISGTLKVRLGRFLHLDTRLAYTDPDKGVTYRLEHSRKMRSRELHYIDNPRFGLLARIRPIEE